MSNKPSEILQDAEGKYSQTFTYDARDNGWGDISYCANGVLAKEKNMRFKKFDTIDAYYINTSRLRKAYNISGRQSFKCDICNESLGFYGYIAHLNDEHRLYFSQIAEHLRRYNL